MSYIFSTPKIERHFPPAWIECKITNIYRNMQTLVYKNSEIVYFYTKCGNFLRLHTCVCGKKVLILQREKKNNYHRYFDGAGVRHGNTRTGADYSAGRRCHQCRRNGRGGRG